MFMAACLSVSVMLSCQKEEKAPEEPGGETPPPVEEAEDPEITWAANPDNETLDITDELDVNLHVSVPGGIKRLVVEVKSDDFAKVLKNMGLNKTYLNLTSDKEVMEVLKDIVPTGDALIDKTEADLDFSSLVKRINDVTRKDGLHVLEMTVTDNNDKTDKITCTFHRVEFVIPIPSFEWESNPTYETLDIDDNLDAVIKVSVPGGIQSITMTVESEALKSEMADEYGIRSGRIILTDSSNLAAETYLNTVCGDDIPFGSDLAGQTEITIDLTAYVKRINDLTNNESDHKVGFVVIDNENQTTSQEFTFHRVAPAGPEIVWKSNPDFSTMNIDENLSADLSVSVPGGIYSFIINVESEALNAYLQENGLMSSLNLLYDYNTILFLRELDPSIIVGDDLNGLTAVDFDFTALVSKIAELTKEESDHTFTIEVMDTNNKTAEVTCVFHRKAEAQGGEIPDPVEGISISWPGNETFAPISADSEYMTLDIKAESGIKGFTITVNSETDFVNMYLPAVTSSEDNVLDLINDAARLETDLTGGFEFDMLLGDEIKDKTALQFDFTGLIADFIGTYAASGEKQECVVTIETNDGKSQTVTCTFIS